MSNMIKVYNSYKYKESDVNEKNYDLVISSQDDFDKLYFDAGENFINWNYARKVLLKGDFVIKKSILIPDFVEEISGNFETNLSIDLSNFTYESLSDLYVFKPSEISIAKLTENANNLFEVSVSKTVTIKNLNINLNPTANRNISNKDTTFPYSLMFLGISSISNISLKITENVNYPTSLCAFCSNINNIYIESSAESLRTDCIVNLGFIYCTNLSNIYINSSSYQSVFQACLNLDNIYINNKIAYVENSTLLSLSTVFTYCYNLNNITLNSKFTDINDFNSEITPSDYGILKDCHNINNIYINLLDTKLNTPGTFGNVFENCRFINNAVIQTTDRIVSENIPSPIIYFNKCSNLNNICADLNTGSYKNVVYIFKNCDRIANYSTYYDTPSGDSVIIFDGANTNVVLTNDIN